MIKFKKVSLILLDIIAVLFLLYAFWRLSIFDFEETIANKRSVLAGILAGLFYKCGTLLHKARSFNNN